MGHTYAELRRMSVDELVHEYDTLAEPVEPTTELCRQEITRRELEEHSQRMLAMTAVMKRLTWAITALTVINVILVGLQLWKSFRP
jgi:hypothetical protein